MSIDMMIYLAGIVNGVLAIACFVIVASLVVTVATTYGIAIDAFNSAAKARKVVLVSVIVSIVAANAIALMPNREALYLMAATKAAQQGLSIGSGCSLEALINSVSKAGQ